MKNVLLQAAIKLNNTRKKKKWWNGSVRIIAAIVVFATTYALILPAITMQADPICGVEEHVHTEACYTYTVQTAINCGHSNVAHRHSGACYESDVLICTLPEIKAHTHTDVCYEPAKVMVCQIDPAVDPEHAHNEQCVEKQMVLTCSLQELAAHDHTEDCRVERTTSVLHCTLPEHTHEDTCYPKAEEVQQGSSSGYLCGMGDHIHENACLDETGALSCSIPEHTHEAACLVADLDLTADVETAQVWEAELAQIPLTGDWAQDVLAIAASQIGYKESTKNVILDHKDELAGYTRYGDWYGLPYGDWCAMFASFVLHYAGVENMPLECGVQRWIDDLTQAQMYYAAGTYEPKPGDLVFIDYDQKRDAEAPVGADHVGFVAELIPATEEEPAKIRTIEGNAGDQVMSITYEADDPTLVGYGCLPENPLTPEQWSAVQEVKAQVAALPLAEDVEHNLLILNEEGDNAGYEALRQELVLRIESIVKLYDSFNDLQKERVGDVENLYALQEVCGGAKWNHFPEVTDDSAVVTGLACEESEVISSENTEDENTIRDGDTVRYRFTVNTQSYYTDISYGEALVKVELVMPLTQDKAVFDTAAMTWLEESRLTTEYRELNGISVKCQVLTGYKRMSAESNAQVLVPGSFTETVTVQVKNMAHGETLAVIISAAMEHSTWDGVCETHQIEERLTVVTDMYTLYEPLSPEEQLLVYQAYLVQIELMKLEEEPDVAALDQQITESYQTGALSAEQYGALYQMVLELYGVDLESVAEPSKGNGWIWLDDAGTGYLGDQTVMYATASIEAVPAAAAMPEEAYRSLALDSNSQIPDDGWGGENSQDDMIWVSKTIEGTEQENVFDITLQVITKEEVNEVYKEPDMAVVVVMDISNTMVSVFSGETEVTRYDAAMDAAQHFLENFAEKTDGISRVGYVAFNTHGHEVFPMQECSTLAQATSLANTMRTKTKSIMDTAAANAGGKYSSSHERFTNIEAGLAMAADMLEGVNNRHKYIIFLSDGFPTTYLTAGTSDGYKGYDPYTSSGTNGNNGVFFDNIMGHHCDYGTSYSDTAAIKARQMAVDLKNEGINIFSIGVDVEGQTIWEYHYDSKTRLKTASTVERRQSVAYYNSTGYEIGTKHSEFADLTSLTTAQEKAMAQDFKDWLKGTATTGIGSGYYYESTDQNGLEAAYSQIFSKILEMNAASSHLDWVATDPMPGMGVHELETIEFIGFWDLWSDNPTLVNVLYGESMDNALYYNTATFNNSTNTISWDLKNSGYQSVSMGNNKNFHCALKYRVRLMNEEGSFIENAIYDTNDVTSLTYRVIEVVNNVTQVSDQKTINFPIPKVFGYLSELNFLKVDPTGDTIAGAKFALTHDTANCGTCRGDGEGHVTLPVYEAVSGTDGVVSFTNIPSGHHYILTETEAPEGYIITNNTYHVEVSYDALTVTVTDADGNPLEWTGNIENDMHYVLPYTGGTGTSLHTLGGLLIILAVACVYVIYSGRKRQKGGRRA